MTATVLVRGHPDECELAGAPGRYGEVEAVAGDGSADAVLHLEAPGPWPVGAGAEALAGEPGDGILVVGAAAPRLLERLAELGPTHHVERVSIAALRAAWVVLLPPAANAGARAEELWALGPVPGVAFPVIAAGRLLLIPPPSPGFGLMAGLDCLSCIDEDTAVELAAVGVREPGTFEPLQALGRLAVAPWRAAVAYPRLARAPRPRAAPRG